MAGLLAAVIVRFKIQSAHRQSLVAVLPAAAVVRFLVHPTHRRYCVAGLPAAAVVWVNLCHKPIAGCVVFERGGIRVLDQAGFRSFVNLMAQGDPCGSFCG